MAFTFWGIPVRSVGGKQCPCCRLPPISSGKRGWVDLKKPYMLCAAGIITGLVNTPLVMVNITLFHLTPAEGPLVVSQFLSGIITSPLDQGCGIRMSY